MKKIMKKALSLALALVMVLTLAPVTAKAATGDMDAPAALPNSSGETIEVVLNDTYQQYFYEWTATDAGFMTLAFETSDTACMVVNTTTGATMFDEWGKASYQFEVVASNTYLIGVTETMGAASFNMTATYSSESGVASVPTGGDSVDNAVDVTNTMTGLIPARSTGYFVVSGLEANTSYTIVAENTAPAPGSYGTYFGITPYYANGEVQADTVTNVVSVSTTAASVTYSQSMVFFAITNDNMDDLTVNLTIEKVSDDSGSGNEPNEPEEPEEPEEPQLGSMDKKDTLVLDTKLTVSTSDFAAYYYTYTASKAGTLSVTMYDDECSNGWILGIATETSDDWSRDVYTESAYATDEDDTTVVENPATYAIEEGETISLYVIGKDWKGGSIAFKATLSEVVEGGNNNNNNNNNNNDDDNYVTDDAPIVVGNNTLTVSNMYAYTVFAFEPTEIGKYTLTTEDSVMGIVGYSTAAGVLTKPSAETVASTTLTMECTSVGQTILVAVKADTNVANIKVSKEKIVIKEIPQTVYPASADAYVFTGDASAIEYVDVQGTTTDKAVLGDDGFYHLNDKTGPILLVNLDDSVFTFVTDETFGSLSVATYDSNGEVVSTVAYGSYVEACLANASSVKHPTYGDVLLYPLTEGLMEVYKTYGAQQGWYNTSMGGYVIGQFNGKYNPEDIWMFACMYVPNAEDGTIVVPPVSIKPDAIVDEKGNVTGYNPIKEEVVKAKIEEAVKENRDLVVETTADGVVMTFAPADLKDAKAVELNIEVALKNDVKDETVAKNDKIKADNFVLKVEFAHTGDLPATATITIPVSTDLDKLFYYEIKADGTLEFVCEAPVKDGVATVKQSHCSDYVLLTERVDVVEEQPGDDANNGTTTPDNNNTTNDTTDASTTPNEAPTTTSPKTGDDTNIALWVAVLGLGVVAIAGSVVMRKREF